MSQIDKSRRSKCAQIRDIIGCLKAFCDSSDGWAFYNGELRHGNKNNGPRYGQAVNKGDMVGVKLDTIEVST